MAYIPTIGLEIHAELKTRTKLFCGSKNDPDEKRPNVNICPVCTGHPGVLPTINREAIWHILRIGAAVGGTIADFTEFDRKNYFYPDIPKGYQISQYAHPFVTGGVLSDVAITRVHLEEDTARSVHVGEENYSLIDFNRAGVPLMELVTEPEITSAEQAGAFARELQLLLRFLGASDANMEKGEMRAEANISISKSKELGTKVEVKNLNSFRAVLRAIAFEIKRQTKLLERGEAVVQETRGWSEEKQQTFPQRLKEGSEDYRYFPEPDLSKFNISEIQEFNVDKIKKSLPELPSERRARYRDVYGIKGEDTEVFLHNDLLRTLFETAVVALEENEALIQKASNYITSDLIGLQRKGTTGSIGNIDPHAFSELILMAEKSEISSRGAKNILAEMFERGGNPRDIAERKSLFQKKNAGELGGVVDAVINEHAQAAEDYRNGKETALQFLVGQGMKATKGSANPEKLKSVFLEKLKN